MKLAGDAPLWRWRFLSAPPSVAQAGERLQCRVALTDEYGSLIKPSIARAVLGEGFRVRCEVCPESESPAQEPFSTSQSAQDATTAEEKRRVSIAGQRSEVPSPGAVGDVCQWYFKPKLPVECTGNSSEIVITVMVRGEGPGDKAASPWLVLALESSPVRVVCSSTAGRSQSKLAVPSPPSLCSYRHFVFQTENLRATSTTNTAQNYSTVCVSIQEEFGANLGAHVWNSGLVLAQWLCQERARLLSSQIDGNDVGGSYPKRILEIGSGCGVASIVASRLGAAVIATDLPPVLPLLLYNVKANVKSKDGNALYTVKESSNSQDDTQVQSGSCRVSPLDWANTYNAESMGMYDVVLAADVLYGPAAYASLLHVLDSLVAQGGLAIIALSHRDHGQAVEEAVLRAAKTPIEHSFFRGARGEFDDKSADETQNCSGKSYQTRWHAKSVYFFANVEVLEMTRVQ